MDRERVVEALTLWGCWSRAVRAGPPIRRRCGSFEAHWAPPCGSVFDDDLQASAPRVADDVAVPVERAVVAAGRMFAAAITMMYVNEMPIAVIARRLGVPDAAGVLDEAHQEVGRRLR